jgi:hypothetical protein
VSVPAFFDSFDCGQETYISRRISVAARSVNSDSKRQQNGLNALN